LLGATAVLWPSRAIGPLDGAPLDARAEAILIGLVLPWVWWLDRGAISTSWSRSVIAGLLVWKLATSLLLGQQGLCAASFARAPLHGTNQGIPIEEASGALRSWDLRADLFAPNPACTAILTRPLPTQADFPAWFLNVTDRMLGTRDFTMAVRGYVTTSQRGTLTIDAEPAMRLAGRIDRQALPADPMVLEPGTHELDLSLALTTGAWRFEPQLDGHSLWDGAIVTTRPPTTADRLFSPWAWLVAPTSILTLLIGLSMRLAALLRGNRVLLGCAAVGAVVSAAFTLAPSLHRATGLLALAALTVPVSARLRNMKGAFLLLGLPWLTFFTSWSLAQVGRFSIYSADDWLTYQVAGHRIYMQGYWLEGGNAAFDFQPFYRWMTGALHLVFGDSSVGEVYWDASALLAGALLAFQIARTAAGFRWGIFAASAALATFTVSTAWHLIGRGLSEIAAAGWAFLAVFLLLRARRGHWTLAASAAVSAALMFYTRLNHLLFGPFLLGMLLPLRTMATPAAVARGVRRIRWNAAAVFAVGFSTGVLLFALRTWHYTGVFSLFHGTSLYFNDTGLRPWTLLDGDVWSRVAHSLWALIWMNEPTQPDVRALVMASGALVAIATLVHLPIARRVPAALLIATIGATIGAFFTHGHPYPGRFSIHVIPLASALTAIAAARVLALRRWSRQ
jgi:hypothetical protein